MKNDLAVFQYLFSTRTHTYIPLPRLVKCLLSYAWVAATSPGTSQARLRLENTIVVNALPAPDNDDTNISSLWDSILAVKDYIQSGALMLDNIASSARENENTGCENEGDKCRGETSTIMPEVDTIQDVEKKVPI